MEKKSRVGVQLVFMRCRRKDFQSQYSETLVLLKLFVSHGLIYKQNLQSVEKHQLGAKITKMATK